MRFFAATLPPRFTGAKRLLLARVPLSRTAWKQIGGLVEGRSKAPMSGRGTQSPFASSERAAPARSSSPPVTIEGSPRSIRGEVGWSERLAARLGSPPTLPALPSADTVPPSVPLWVVVKFEKAALTGLASA